VLVASPLYPDLRLAWAVPDSCSDSQRAGWVRLYRRAGQETAVATLRMSAVPQPSRRAVLGSAAAVIAGNLIQGAPAPSAAARLPADDDVTIYVGAGCFWHVQHEMTVAEQKLLGRGDDSFTAIAGYAGGSKLGKDGKVCYHNMAFDSDYGKLGHTEVVAVRVPQDSVPGFVEAYVNLFNGKGIRADPQDQGGEYRCGWNVDSMDIATA